MCWMAGQEHGDALHAHAGETPALERVTSINPEAFFCSQEAPSLSSRIQNISLKMLLRSRVPARSESPTMS